MAALEPGGTLVLSGLLRNQEKMVLSFYQGLRFVGTAGATGPGARWCWKSPIRALTFAAMDKNDRLPKL